MNSLLEKLGNYFFGLDIPKYYKSQKQIYSKHIGSENFLGEKFKELKFKELDKHQRKFIILGKIVPGTIDLASIISSVVTKNPLYVLGVSASLALREHYKMKFIYQQFENICEVNNMLSQSLIKKLQD